MKTRNRHIVSVEVATADRSDFDVSEIYLRLVSDKYAKYLIEKKNYRSIPLLDEDECGEVGTVLLPNYRLHLSERLYFDRVRSFFWHKYIWEGISL